jgi:hypothetical protein
MRLRRRKGRHPEDPTARVRSEARAAARSKRAAARTRARAERREELGLRVRGLGLETRRRLRPAGRAFGPPGGPYSDAKAELIDGFWAQLSASVVLVFTGPLLGSYVRGASGFGGEPDPARRRRRRSRRMRPVVAAREARP